MAGQSRKWMILIATTWIQAFTGTNFDFSAYSSTVKSVLGISQVQLNYLSVASDMGKAFGWCSGLALHYFPLWVVLFMSGFIGLFGYGVQWLVIQRIINLPYILVFLLCLMAGCSVCWFNTVCFVLCIKNFHTNRALALSLTISFNGLTAALYTLIVNAINSSDDTIYPLTNAVVPLFVSALALLPILRQPTSQQLSPDSARYDSFIFLVLNVVAIITGLYVVILYSLSSNVSAARILLAGAIALLVLPLFLPGIVWARHWARRNIFDSWSLQGSTFNLIDADDLELFKELIADGNGPSGFSGSSNGSIEKKQHLNVVGCFTKLVEKNRLTMLGEEHSTRLLVRRWDFWLYYVAYFCGGTIGLVYSNNLGQIAQSLGYYSEVNSLVTLYSAFSFFGRLISAAPDFLRDKAYFARTGWLAVAVVPTPVALFLLVASGSETILRTSTALIGLSSGFVFAASVSITSELFGPNSVGVNHNILITNIPLGSLLYGLLAASVYDSSVKGSNILETTLEETMVCIGRKCYLLTFTIWGCISLIGLVSCVVLYLRTRLAYDRFGRNRNQTESYD